MKKEFRFKYRDEKFIIENCDNIDSAIYIDVNKLEFDTLSYYNLLFDDVVENISIKINYNINESEIEDKEIEKKAKYIYKSINDLTNEICEKINKDCFSSKN